MDNCRPIFMGLLKNSPRWKIYPQSQTNHLQSKKKAKSCCTLSINDSISPLLSCLLNLAAATLPLSSNHTHTTEMASATKENKKNSKSLSLSNKVQEKKVCNFFFELEFLMFPKHPFQLSDAVRNLMFKVWLVLR